MSDSKSNLDSSLRKRETTSSTKYSEKAPNVNYMKQLGSLEALEGVNGVVIRQKAFPTSAVMQAITGLPIQRQNQYTISPVPASMNADEISYSDYDRMELPVLFSAQEKSNYWERILLGCLGCQHLRTLSMNFSKSRYKVLEEDDPVDFRVKRNFSCGGFCCMPHSAAIESEGHLVGSVIEDFHCGKNWLTRYVQHCCLCMNFYEVFEGKEKKYEFIINQGFCGGHNNCCAPTCCNPTASFDIYETSGKGSKETAVASFHRSFGGKVDKSALFRCCFDYSNYLVKFPQNSTGTEKALILGSVLNTEYVFFENTGQ